MPGVALLLAKTVAPIRQQKEGRRLPSAPNTLVKRQTGNQGLVVAPWTGYRYGGMSTARAPQAGMKELKERSAAR